MWTLLLRTELQPQKTALREVQATLPQQFVDEGVRIVPRQVDGLDFAAVADFVLGRPGVDA